MRIEDYKNSTTKLNDFTRWSKQQRGVSPSPEEVELAVVRFIANTMLSINQLIESTRPKQRLKQGGFIVNGPEDIEKILTYRDLDKLKHKLDGQRLTRR